MKSIPQIISILLAAVTAAHSQDDANSASRDYQSAPATFTTARILGEIPDGTPPPLAPPKPEFHVPARDVLSTVSHEQNGRTITIREIKPIALPQPPTKISIDEADGAFNQGISEYREEQPQNELLVLGATVFRSKDSPPRTLVHWWPQGAKENITFWSSADFALIAGGVNSFADSTGASHHLMVGWNHVDIERMAEIHTTKSREYGAPELPEFPEGKATFEITGDTKPTGEELAVIQSLHDIYNHELKRLKTAYASRERARIEREEYLKRNPPQPKDITLNFWRTEKPAPNEKGADK